MGDGGDGGVTEHRHLCRSLARPLGTDSDRIFRTGGPFRSASTRDPAYIAGQDRDGAAKFRIGWVEIMLTTALNSSADWAAFEIHYHS